MIALLKTHQRFVFFVGTGATAALTHLVLVLNLVDYFNLQPLIANFFAFLISFNVSFLGHRYLTFANLSNQKKLSMPHFFLIASSAGILNETLYFILLRYTDLNYLIALIFVLGTVAVYTYVLSRFWACR